MAEYYPLLAKAVSGLTNSTPETRRSIYERARNALLKQLRSIQPPIAEADIDREAKALDAAIARLEAELSVQSSLEEGLGAALGLTEEKPAAPPPAKPIAQEPPKPSTPPAPKSEAAKSEPAKSEPAKPASTFAKPFSPPAEEKKPQAGAPAKTGGLSGFAAPKTPLPKAGDEEFSPYDDSLGGEAPPPLRTRQGAQRPAAPQPSENEGRQRRLGIVAGVVAAVVCLVAFAAWKLRDRPEDIAKLKPPPQQVESGGSKIVERVGGGQREADSSSRTQTPPPPVSESGQALPIAHRSALLVEAPEEAAKVKTYIGRVVWKLENAAGGPGQALTSAVRAEVDIAEAGLQAVMTIQKNNDSTLPASHTIRIRFTPIADGPTGNVKDIRMLETRREDMANGDPLAGINAQIAENAFLIGLMRGGAEATNVDMMRTRSWFDLPMLLANGKRAKITFEKGVSGERILADALKQWGAQ